MFACVEPGTYYIYPCYGPTIYVPMAKCRMRFWVSAEAGIEIR